MLPGCALAPGRVDPVPNPNPADRFPRGLASYRHANGRHRPPCPQSKRRLRPPRHPHRGSRGSSRHVAAGPRRQRTTRWWGIFSAPLLIAAVAIFIVVADNDPLWHAAWRATHDDDHRLAILCDALRTGLRYADDRVVVRARHETAARRRCAVAARGGKLRFLHDPIRRGHRRVDDPQRRRNHGARSDSPSEQRVLLACRSLRRLARDPRLSSRRSPDCAGEPSSSCASAPRPSELLCWRRRCTSTTPPWCSSAERTTGCALQINPAYPLWAAATFGMSSDEDALTARRPLDVRSGAARATPHKPALVVLVMGETARADRFSFNGYERDTNRYTRARDVVNFPRVISCGTSTAESVPCLFSGLGQAQFSHEAALSRESIVGAMQRLGVSTFWRDNSTGCKDVCDEQHFEQRANWTHADLCDATGCFDELFSRTSTRCSPIPRAITSSSCINAAATAPPITRTCRVGERVFSGVRPAELAQLRSRTRSITRTTTPFSIRTTS